MRLLLDTHAVFWWLVERRRLSPRALAAIEAEASEVYISVASAWEMGIKVGAGRWPEAAALLLNFEASIAQSNFNILPITIVHVRTAGLMKSPHRDPFDRLLAAQAIVEGLTLVTADAHMQSLGAPRLW